LAASAARQSDISAGLDLSQGYTCRQHGASWTLLILVCLGSLFHGTPTLEEYNLLPHTVPNAKDEIHCPAGTTEEPKGYFSG